MAEINSKATDSLPTTINEGKRNLTIFSYGVQKKRGIRALQRLPI